MKALIGSLEMSVNPMMIIDSNLMNPDELKNLNPGHIIYIRKQKKMKETKKDLQQRLTNQATAIKNQEAIIYNNHIEMDKLAASLRRERDKRLAFTTLMHAAARAITKRDLDNSLDVLARIHTYLEDKASDA